VRLPLFALRLPSLRCRRPVRLLRRLLRRSPRLLPASLMARCGAGAEALDETELGDDTPSDEQSLYEAPQSAAADMRNNR
jgi:hypothetical protein